MKYYESWAEKLTAPQRNALENYAKQDYKEINDYLRNQGGSGNENLNEKIQNISDALEQKPIPEEITVYRWCGMAEYGYKIDEPLPTLKDFEDKFLDKIKDDKGYMSTSLSSESLSGFGPRKIILRLQVPKGSKGAYISAIGGFQNEKEILLDKGSKYHAHQLKAFYYPQVQKNVILSYII